MSLIKIDSLESIDAGAEEFLRQTRGHKLIAFHGSMGAGKTTFIVALCKALGIEDDVCSPTFTIINEYRTREDGKVYHFDFYRITKLSEAMDIGVEDYFYSGELCLMEWPENIEAIIPEETLNVYITVNPDGSRELKF